jgi:phosphatidylglycerol:prolipoprotein diacylglycerol transferase
VHKIAFHIGSFTIHWYGVLVALGFLVGLWTASRRGLQHGFAPEKVFDAGVWLIIGTVLGARALYVVSYWDKLMENPLHPSMPWTEIFMVQRGGLVFYGGLIGASLATLLYVWKNKLPLWKFADTLAPSIALGYAPGRLGCLMNGCCYGKPTDLPWGIHFPPGHDAFGHAVHPTQIYDALLSLGLYLGLAWLFRRKKFDGQVFATYLLCYAITRSTVEIFRGDYPVRYLGGFATPAHLVSIGIFAIGAILYWQLSTRTATAPPATASSGKARPAK